MTTTASSDPGRSVLVYGTLRPGEPNFNLVDWAEPECIRATLNGWELLGAGRGFPYAVPEPGKSLTGDVLTFPKWAWDDVLDRMDMLEGVPHHYLRTVCTADTDRGPICAWVYTPTFRPTYAPVPGGDWKAHMDDRRFALAGTGDTYRGGWELDSYDEPADDQPWWETYRDGRYGHI